MGGGRMALEAGNLAGRKDGAVMNSAGSAF